jgi:hypothetical protein
MSFALGVHVGASPGAPGARSPSAFGADEIMLSVPEQAVAGERGSPRQRIRYFAEFDVPDELLCDDEDPELDPVVELLLLGSSVRIVMECGPMTIITGSPFLSLALTRYEPGTISTFVNPSEESFCLISCGTL